MSENADVTCFPLPEYLLGWFDKNKRPFPWRENRDAYRVWVSEIMLQQTRIEAAREHYIRFMRELPTVYDLAGCDDEKLMKLWEGLGYYSRARNLKKCAVEIVERYGGVFPREKEKLLSLPGIGEYTAGAISSIVYDEKNPAIDGNVLRVCARVEGDFTPINDAARRKSLYGRLKSVYPEQAGAYTQALMELGETVCTVESPRCAVCPMRGRCRAEEEGWQKSLPVLPRKPEKKRLKLLVFLLVTPQGIALKKRPDKGVLAGMWEFFNVQDDGTPPEEALRRAGVAFSRIERAGEHTHVFTHLIWEMTAYKVQADLPEGMSAFSLEELQKSVSLATAFRWGAQILKGTI